MYSFLTLALFDEKNLNSKSVNVLKPKIEGRREERIVTISSRIPINLLVKPLSEPECL